ncbi:MAG: hypothetical protein ABQ298_03820 [Puniceicoccaceae bacterium]
MKHRTISRYFAALALFTLPLLIAPITAFGAKKITEYDEIADYSTTDPIWALVSEDPGSRKVDLARLANYAQVNPAAENGGLDFRRSSHTLTWAGTSDTLTLATGFMRHGRVIKSLTIRHANAGTFDLGNRSVLNFYADDVVTTASVPTVATMTNITWDWSDGDITVTPSDTHTGSITVDIEYVDNPPPTYVTNEETLTLYAASVGYQITDSEVQTAIATTIETLSGGRNTVLFSAGGVPGIYVKIDPDVDTLHADILTELGYTTSDEHPAFTVDGAPIDHFWVGKYEGTLIDVTTGTVVSNASAKTSANLRVASLKRVDPAADITFDETITVTRQNGAGYHSITNAQWAYLALRSLTLDHEVRGNNDSGTDYIETTETGTLVVDGYDATDIHVLSGAPYVAWSHDNTQWGVWDLNGNVFEWVVGVRFVDGEIQVIPDNDAVLSTADFGVASSDWRGIAAADGSLTAPGTPGNLHWDASNVDGSGNLILDDAVTNQSDGSTSSSTQFNAITSAVGITAPAVLKSLALYPLTIDSPARGRVYMRNLGERIPRRGGAWVSSSGAGVSALDGYGTRGIRVGSLGFRPAFVD